MLQPAFQAAEGPGHGRGEGSLQVGWSWGACAAEVQEEAHDQTSVSLSLSLSLCPFLSLFPLYLSGFNLVFYSKQVYLCLQLEIVDRNLGS